VDLGLWWVLFLLQGLLTAPVPHSPSPASQVGVIPANAVDDGQWSQGLISAVSIKDT